LSDEEQDWIAKYRAALDSGAGQGSSTGAVKAAIRSVWRLLGFGIPLKTADSSAEPLPSARKLSQSKVPPAKKSDTKAS
jgi:hypothetical protein